MGRRWDRFRELATREENRDHWSAPWGIVATVMAGGCIPAFLAAASPQANRLLYLLAVFMAVVALFALYLVFAPLMHTWPYHPLKQRNPPPAHRGISGSALPERSAGAGT